MLNLQSPHFLRRVLLADAATCLATGLLLTLGADVLQPLLGLPQALLCEAGMLLYPFAALVLFTATRPQLPRMLVWVIVISNALWAFDSAMLLLAGWVTPTLPGKAFVVVQALAVALFAELEFFGLRRQAAVA
ncbi:hypothetical protein [Noviherbaspirillum sp. UKPF54]|uniref:hypothetical protein n=1 Tax=Noviherbaspirillum sp. UKPF54 TaxID=2601898 RepID=UPI0011B15235|nr:hypothetical protein [Noviherbaspirillum sp. UKPF54]QDZ29496.1 hypothetical protein FAY22_16935 [Noviherbaspirillum sp. UKPF54]